LGIHILEDLGVPRAWLGTSARAPSEAAPWKWPSSFYEVRLLIARRIGLVPVAMALMALIFFLSFRTLAATFLPMLEVGASLIFLFGLMGYTNVPVYLTIAVVPVLLTAMAVTDEIHIFSRYFASLRERPDANHVELVRSTMEEMCCPVVNTSLTTAIGFVSFAFSPLGPVQAFGIFTGLGVLFCLVWSLSVMPALLVLLDPNWFRSPAWRRAPSSAGTESSLFVTLTMLVVRYRYLVLGVTALVIALTPFGLRRLVIQDSWIDGFDPDSEFSRTTRLVNEQYRGIHLLYVSFDAGRVWGGTVPAGNVTLIRSVLPAATATDSDRWAGCWLSLSLAAPAADGSTNGVVLHGWRSTIESATVTSNEVVLRTQYRDENASFWKERPNAATVHYDIISQPHLQPELLRTIADFDSYIEDRRRYKVGSVLSPADYVATTRFMVRPNEAGSRRLPADAIEAKLMFDYYRIVRGPEQLRQVVDTNYARSLLAVFLKEANFVDTAKLMRDIRSYERERLAPQGIRLGFAGDTAVSQSLIQSIVTTQLQSLLGSLLGILAVTSLLGRSLRWGIYCVVPSALAVLINFAVMGWFGIPLGVAT
jgi:predicted RND superfamily exporter protein